MNPYDDTNDDLVGTYGRVHSNGEQTHVALLSCGDAAYVAVAFDVYPGEFEPIASECIAFDPTLEGAHTRAQRWMQDNPKGVAPGDDSGGESGGRAWDMVKGAAKRLNDYGNQVAQQQQQRQQGGPKQ